MFDSKTLTRSLLGFVGVAEPKQANAFTTVDEVPVDNAKLQEIVGDPDTHRLSWSTQTKPSTGDTLQFNPNSPLQGDDVFFSGLFDGARFQDKDGEWWDVENYDWEGAITIRNVWRPRTEAIISIQVLRNCIHSWIEPFLQRVPPPPAGVDYGVVQTREA